MEQREKFPQKVEPRAATGRSGPTAGVDAKEREQDPVLASGPRVHCGRAGNNPATGRMEGQGRGPHIPHGILFRHKRNIILPRGTWMKPEDIR